MNGLRKSKPTKRETNRFFSFLFSSNPFPCLLSVKKKYICFRFPGCLRVGVRVRSFSFCGFRALRGREKGYGSQRLKKHFPVFLSTLLKVYRWFDGCGFAPFFFLFFLKKILLTLFMKNSFWSKLLFSKEASFRVFITVSFLSWQVKQFIISESQRT